MLLRAIPGIPWKPMKIVFYYVVIDREKTRAELARLAGGRRTLRFENRLRHKRGTFSLAFLDGGARPWGVMALS
jgi:hypothetical protein